MDWKKIGKKLLFPPLWVLILLTLFSAAALAAVFVYGLEQTVAGYALYPVAAYTLTVVCIHMVLIFPGKYKALRLKIDQNPLANRYFTDRTFRDTLSLHLSLAINLMYVGLNLWSWHTIGSWWFMVLAVYYGILAIMRFLLVKYVRSNPIGQGMTGEWRRARVCAWILLLINLSLSGAVLMILYQSKGYDYPGVMIYVMALFTFYSTIHAIMELIKRRKMESPVMAAAKIVTLSAALVSMLNLETAMFAQFGGEMTQQDQNLMIILTGAGISVTVVSLSVILIVRATREIRREYYGK